MSCHCWAGQLSLSAVAGKLAEAEKALVAGGVPGDAYDMHMRAGKFQDALRLCERYHLAGMQQALTSLVQKPFSAPCFRTLVSRAAQRARSGQ